MSSLEYKKSLVNMGLFLKDALDMGNQPYDPSNRTGLVTSQKDLRSLLGKLWNNQDNLTKEDIQTLEYLSKK
jgi:hypothetical protein